MTHNIITIVLFFSFGCIISTTTTNNNNPSLEFSVDHSLLHATTFHESELRVGQVPTTTLQIKSKNESLVVTPYFGLAIFTDGEGENDGLYIHAFCGFKFSSPISVSMNNNITSTEINYIGIDPNIEQMTIALIKDFDTYDLPSFDRTDIKAYLYNRNDFSFKSSTLGFFQTLAAEIRDHGKREFQFNLVPGMDVVNDYTNCYLFSLGLFQRLSKSLTPASLMFNDENNIENTKIPQGLLNPLEQLGVLFKPRRHNATMTSTFMSIVLEKAAKVSLTSTGKVQQVINSESPQMYGRFASWAVMLSLKQHFAFIFTKLASVPTVVQPNFGMVNLRKLRLAYLAKECDIDDDTEWMGIQSCIVDFTNVSEQLECLISKDAENVAACVGAFYTNNSSSGTTTLATKTNDDNDSASTNDDVGVVKQSSYDNDETNAGFRLEFKWTMLLLALVISI